MPALLATFLLFSIAGAVATTFAPPPRRRLCRRFLLATLFVAWLSLGAAIVPGVTRTATTLVTRGGARQPHLIEQATREGLTLLLSMGGPALIATIVGLLAIKASHRKEA